LLCRAAETLLWHHGYDCQRLQAILAERGVVLNEKRSAVRQFGDSVVLDRTPGESGAPDLQDGTQ
jgi:hypothetical protein